MNIETINKQLKSIERKINNALDAELSAIIRQHIADMPMSMLSDGDKLALRKINLDCDIKLYNFNVEKKKLVEQLKDIKETEDGIGGLL